MEEIEDVGGENGGEKERHDQYGGMTATEVAAQMAEDAQPVLVYSDEWWGQWLKRVYRKRKSTNFDSGDGYLAALHKDLGIILTRAPEWVIDALREKWPRIYKKMPFFIDTIRLAYAETVETLPDPGTTRECSLPTDKIVAHLMAMSDQMQALRDSIAFAVVAGTGAIDPEPLDNISRSLVNMAGDITEATTPLTEKEVEDAR